MMEHNPISGIIYEWNILLLLGCFAVGIYYQRKQQAIKMELTQKQKGSFYTGLALFAIAMGTPVYSIGHYLFSVHMIIQSIIYLAVPPLLLYGLPKRELGEVLNRGGVLQCSIRFLTNPVIAVLLFNGIFSFYHVPFIFDYLMTNSFFMGLSTFVLFVLAIIMWWPVVSPAEFKGTMKPLYKIAYICVMGILLTPACALIIFSKDLLYTSYMQAPQLFGIGSLDDQQAGGALMKFIQEIIYGTVIGFIFFAWSKDQKNDELENKLGEYEEEYLNNLREL